MEERLAGKNILIVIPKDYYMEAELDPILESMNAEGAKVLVASAKLKEAVGMKGGTTNPDVLIVDAIEGITGDSYVSDAKGVRQIKGVFHGVIVIGGNGARSYLWKDELLRLLLTDRHRTRKQKAVAALEDSKAVLVDEAMTITDRIFTVQDASGVPAFLDPFIEAVVKTPTK